MQNKQFDLDAAVNQWLKNLRKFEGYEDGQIYEIEDHLRSEIAHLCKEGWQEKMAFEKAIENFGSPAEVNQEMSKLKARPGLFFYLPSSFKIALRKIRRNSTINWLNIFSLSIGLAVFLFIGLFILYEYSYDRFHKKGDRIYRLELELFQSGQWVPSSTNSYYAGEVVKLNAPQVEEMVQIVKAQGTFSYNQQKFTEKKAAVVSSNFFNVFSVDFRHGASEGALKNPNSIVLDVHAAQKYFGEENPVGKQLLLEDYQQLMTVTAVIEPIPPNAHFAFDVFVSFESVKERMNEQVFTNPGWTLTYDYLLLKEGADIKELEAQFPSLVENHIPTFDNNNFKFRARPLFDIHFHAHSGEELGINRDFKQIRILTYIALLILLMTIFNYLNLSTARYMERIKEVGLRKVFGAEKSSIRLQFWTESLLYTFTAFVLSGILIALSLPFFNALTEAPINIHVGFVELFLIIGFWLLLSVLVSLHPVMILPTIKITNALSKKWGLGSSSTFRRVLVFLQFSLTLALLAGLFIMNKQVNFLQNTDPGFRTEGVFSFLKGRIEAEKLEAFKDELLQDPSVLSIGQSSIDMPGTLQSSTFFRADSIADNPDNVIKAVYVDAQFFETMDLQLSSGTHFDAQKGMGQVILNEEAVEKFGWSEPLQKSFTPKNADWEGQVVGVAKDFNFESLYNEIIPVAFFYDPDNTHWMYVRYTGDIRQILPRVRAIAEGFYSESNTEFRPELIDDRLAEQYKADQIILKLAGLFTFISILIAGMGIFGMAFFITQKKTKEIAIRKVVGANIPQIFWFLTNDLLGLLLLAALIACPLTYFGGIQWLTSFPYRISISLELFLWALLFTVMLTILASGIVVLKAALQNPIKSLRYE